jgi:uncharacterized protein YjdB
MIIPTIKCETERNSSKLSTTNNKFCSATLNKRQNCLSIFSIENYITKLLPYEEVINEYAAKKCRQKSIVKVCQAVN